MPRAHSISRLKNNFFYLMPIYYERRPCKQPLVSCASDAREAPLENPTTEHLQRRMLLHLWAEKLVKCSHHQCCWYSLSLGHFHRQDHSHKVLSISPKFRVIVNKECQFFQSGKENLDLLMRLYIIAAP